MSHVLITGSNGLLGQKLVDYCLAKKIDFVATSRGENRYSKCPEENYVSMDVSVESEVSSVLQKVQPKYVLHTAAMTNVDACELNPAECKKINTDAVGYLIEASKRINAHFQLVSTDFVFDGVEGGYKEDDAINPLSVYAQSKADAESLLKESGLKSWSIIRTSLVYGRAEDLTNSNIVFWAKGALEKGGPLTIVDDQFRAPTFAEDLASACMAVVIKEETGVYHICGPESKSIFDWVHVIANHFNLSTDQISKVSSSTLNQAAKRPMKTGLDLSKSRKQLSYDPHTMVETLEILFPEHD